MSSRTEAPSWLSGLATDSPLRASLEESLHSTATDVLSDAIAEADRSAARRTRRRSLAGFGLGVAVGYLLAGWDLVDVAEEPRAAEEHAREPRRPEREGAQEESGGSWLLRLVLGTATLAALGYAARRAMGEDARPASDAGREARERARVGGGTDVGSAGPASGGSTALGGQGDAGMAHGPSGGGPSAEDPSGGGDREYDSEPVAENGESGE